MLLLVPAKATEKHGASNVEPAPVRVGASPPGLAAATTDAVVSRLLVLVQAAVSSASAAGQVAGCGERRGPGAGAGRRADLGAPVRGSGKGFSGGGSGGSRPGRPSGRRPRGCPAAGCRTGPGR